MATPDDLIATLLAEHGRTFADEVGIDLHDDASEPSFMLLVTSLLFASRIDHRLAVAAAQALFVEGWTTPEALRDAGWQARTATLNGAGYARYDESTSRMLGDTCDLAIERYDGDLRRLRAETGGDRRAVRNAVMAFKGIGEVGADIFCREVQAAWTELAPFVDDRTAGFAGELGLPADASELADRVGDDLPRLLAALVRAATEGDLDRIRGRAGGDGPAPVDPSSATRDALYERARELDVAGRSRMNKNELAGAVASAQDSGAGTGLRTDDTGDA